MIQKWGTRQDEGMDEKTSLPYEWVRAIAPELAALDAVPLVGAAPHFPWEQFSTHLAKTFEIESLKIAPGEWEWKSKEDLQHDLGDHLIPQWLSIASFEGEFCWLMAEQDLTSILSSLLTKSPPGELEEFDPEFEAGFHRFLGIECLNALTKVEFDPSLAPHLLQKNTLPEGPALCLDVHIHLFDHSFLGRLVLPPAFRHSWAHHYSQENVPPLFSKQLLDQCMVPLHLQAGTLTLSQEEWKELAPGDFLLLDQIGLKGAGQEGTLTLTLGEHPIARAALKDGSLNILESSIYLR